MTRIPAGEADAGYVFVSQDDDGCMQAAAVGAQVGSGLDRPPYIVVDHAPGSAILARWPGRLWRVTVLQRASDQPLAYANYTRATRVRVLEELPLACLFVHQGEAVVGLLGRVGSLSLADKAALAALEDKEADRLHNAVVDRWLEQVQPDSIHMGQEHRGMIAMGGVDPRSPVGNASAVFYDVLRKRAETLEGEAAFELDEEGDRCLTAAWHRVADRLHNALYGIGAPDALLTPEERQILLRAYRSVIG